MLCVEMLSSEVQPAEPHAGKSLAATIYCTRRRVLCRCRFLDAELGCLVYSVLATAAMQRPCSAFGYLALLGSFLVVLIREEVVNRRVGVSNNRFSMVFGKH